MIPLTKSESVTNENNPDTNEEELPSPEMLANNPGISSINQFIVSVGTFDFTTDFLMPCSFSFSLSFK